MLASIPDTLVSVDGGCWSPVRGQELVEPAHGVSVGHALKDVLKIGEGLDVIELGGGYEGADHCPVVGAAVGSSEQMVLAAERDGPKGVAIGIADCCLRRCRRHP